MAHQGYVYTETALLKMIGNTRRVLVFTIVYTETRVSVL